MWYISYPHQEVTTTGHNTLKVLQPAWVIFEGFWVWGTYLFVAHVATDHMPFIQLRSCVWLQTLQLVFLWRRVFGFAVTHGTSTEIHKHQDRCQLSLLVFCHRALTCLQLLSYSCALEKNFDTRKQKIQAILKWHRRASSKHNCLWIKSLINLRPGHIKIASLGRM